MADVLGDTPVVCLLGPRQCGKTTLVLNAAPNRAYISLDEQNYFNTARMDPEGFLASLPSVVTIDEIQRVPELLPVIKRSVDLDRRPGRFLLTGSASLLLLPTVTESLAGRMEIIRLQPLTESEKERAPGAFLREMIQGTLPTGLGEPEDNKSVTLAARVVAGGYPEPITRRAPRARQWHRQYVQSIIERDIRDVGKVREVEQVGRLLDFLCLQTSSLLNVSGLAQTLGLHRVTVENCLLLLERLFLVRRLPAWHSHESTRLVKAPKLHIVDSGLAATLAGLEEIDWLERRDAMGHLLESFVVQQVMAQAGWTDPDLRFWHYRDKDQVEVDLVITKGLSVWGIEVKASATVKPDDAKGLSRLAAQAGKHFEGGILLYAGKDTLPLGPNGFLAVPLAKLWQL